MDSFYLDYKFPVIEKIFIKQAYIKDIEVDVMRLDLIHPFISGNKYYKLKYNLLRAKNKDSKGLISFGGAYSNYILSLAKASYLMKLPSVGIIRGDELGFDLDQTLKNNPLLSQANSWGMNFLFISRAQYRKKYERKFILEIKKKYPHFYMLPEGGTNYLAIKGVGEMLTSQTASYDYICTPIGSAGTFCGLLKGSHKNQLVLGISSLKNVDFSPLIKKYAPFSKNYQIIDAYHFGGFAKTSNELNAFIKKFNKENLIELDATYNGKMFYAIEDLLKKDFFKKKARILIIYTLEKKGMPSYLTRNKKINDEKN